MINTYLNITVIIEWIAFLAGMVLLSKHTGHWRLFIVLLALVLTTETLGWYLSYVRRLRTNALPFNILMIITKCFLLWMLTHHSTVGFLRRSRNGLLMTFTGYALLNLLWLQGFHVYNYFTEIAGDALLAVSCGITLFSLIKDDNPEANLFTDARLWLSVGVLFSAAGSFLLYMFLHELMDYYKQTKIDLYGYINYTVNVLFYTCLIIAFVCRRNQRSLPV